MASHMAAANALVGHEESKAAAHAQSKPPSNMPVPSSKHIGSAPLLHAVPLGEPTGDLESKFTVYECLAQLLGAASIDSPAARSAFAKRFI